MFAQIFPPRIASLPNSSGRGNLSVQVSVAEAEGGMSSVTRTEGTDKTPQRDERDRWNERRKPDEEMVNRTRNVNANRCRWR